MGLDYLIYLNIRDKETKVTKHLIEIAYWRKGFGIRDVIQEIVRKPIYLLDSKSDYITISSTAALSDIIDRFMKSFGDIENSMWTNSIFSPISTRDNTIRQTANLFAAKYWISHPEDDEAFRLMWEEYNKADMDIFDDYNNNKNNYEVVITVENSY